MRAFKVAAATVGLSAALVGVAAGPASAAPACQGGYPAAQCTMSVSDSRVVVGQTVNFSAGGFGANEMVTVTLTQGNTVVVIGEFQANAQGVVSGSFKVPNVKPGRYALTATGESSRGSQSVALNVLPNETAAGTNGNPAGAKGNPAGLDSLAFTGSDAGKTAGAGAVLLLGGGALIVAARRRKHVNAAA
jgi:hypothetical protein